jgi:superfamily II helicase
MVFLLAMEPLHRLFQRAQEENLLSKVSNGCQAFRVSLYADDVVVFIKPTVKDLQATNAILDIFAKASGLTTNMEKTQFYPI